MQVELIKADPSSLVGNICEVENDEIADAIAAAYDGKILNQTEQAPINLRGGALIVKVTIVKIESITPSNITYGICVEETAFKCYPAESHKSKIKIIGGAAQQKQLFKTDFNFQNLGIGGLDK